MAEKIQIQEPETNEVVDRVTGFWQNYNRPLLIGLAALVLVVGGIFAYKYFVSDPNQQKATEAIFRAESYYRQDSLKMALNGDAINPGFVKIASKYDGTKAGNLAKFYAGSAYLKMGDYANAVKYLKDFSTSSKQVQARATALLADAYAEQGKKDEAVDLYRKAGTMFERDDYNSPEYLFRAGALYELMGKPKDAIEVYKIIKEKYPRSERGFEIDKYLARLGVTDSE
jgi:tetratricopeptide (TPR) repeat protein